VGEEVWLRFRHPLSSARSGKVDPGFPEKSCENK
jgi:hypothetical protein